MNRRAVARLALVLATITNTTPASGRFSAGIPARILRTPAGITQHVDAIVDLCASKGYDGVDLDWESLRPHDRDRFSGFVAELGDRLRANGKILTIAVHPKESEPGTWRGPRAQDWAALGAAVDEFKVMTYDYSGSWSAPGPIAPPAWANAGLAHAESLVPPGKIMMGVPFYGYDWRGRRTTGVSWSDAQALIAAFAPTLLRDASGEPYFGYADDRGRPRTVYFQDRAALAAKLDMLRTHHPSIGGVAIWVMGGEDPTFWDEIALQLR